MSATPPSPTGAARVWALLAMLALVAVIHVAWGLLVDTAVSHGNLADSDAYARMVRVDRLVEGGAWFDVSLPRANVPDGGSLHWTRPLDVLLIALALPLAPALGLKAALFWSGALISPLLHLGLAAALAWAAVPLLGRAGGLIAGALTVTQFGILGYAVIGRADHHMLLALTTVVAFGFMVRAFAAEDGGARPAAWAGWALAFGLWVGVEAQVMTALALAVMGLEWVLAGERALDRNRGLALGLLVGVVAALLVERGPTGMFALEYDRISLVHLSEAAIAVAFWLAVAWRRGRGGSPGGPRARLLAAAIGGVTAVAGLRLAFPRVLANPVTDFDPEFLEIFLRTAELGPIDDVWHFLLYVGAAVVALPWGIRRVRDAWTGAGRWPWLLVVGLAAVYTALAVTWLRWALFAGPFLALIVADAMIAADAAVDRRLRSVSRTGVKAAVMLALAVGPLALGAWGVYAAMPGPAPVTVSDDPRPCPLRALATVLAAPPLGDRPRTIVASPNFGAELLYRTPHRVIATVHHRHRDGIVAGVRILGGTDVNAIRALIEERRVELVLLCRFGHEAYGGKGEAALYRRLERGEHPRWLAPVTLPEPLGRSFLLFRVTEP